MILNIIIGIYSFSNEGHSCEHLGATEIETIHDRISKDKRAKKRKPYFRWTYGERFIAAAVRHYQSKYTGLNGSTVRGFKFRPEKEFEIATKRQLTNKRNLIQPEGRAFMLGDEIDKKVQLYIQQMSQHESVVSRSIAASVATVLLERDESYGKIKITGTWAKSLLKRMGFVRREKTSSTVEIPEGGRTEVEYQYLYLIVNAIEKWDIHPDLVANFDRTSSKLVPVGRSTLAKRNNPNVTIADLSDKRTITVKFAVSLSGAFLPPNLIYGGKTTQSVPKYEFLKSFSLGVNTHYNKSQESIKFIEEILVPYFTKKDRNLGLTADQKCLLIFDLFIRQMTSDVKEVIEKHNLLLLIFR